MTPQLAEDARIIRLAKSLEHMSSQTIEAMSKGPDVTDRLREAARRELLRRKLMGRKG